MGKYSLILWDLDGTLADTSEGVMNAVKYAGEKMGLNALPEETYRKFIGPPNKETYGRYWGLSGDVLAQAISFHKEYATSKGACEACLYDDMKKLLQSIREHHIKQAVTTLKLQESAEKVLHFLGVDKEFDYILGAVPGMAEKAELLHKCIELAGVDKDACALVGDSIYDQIGAQDCGIDFIGVTYGFGFRNEADMQERSYAACVNSVEELEKLLLDD